MIKQIGPEEYKEICKWWDAHCFPKVPAEALPSTGFMVFRENIGIYAGFLLIPREGTMGWAEWFVSNPESPKELRAEAFSDLMGVINNLAKESGLNTIFASAEKSNVGFINRLKSAGFIDGNETVTHLMKLVWES